MAIRQKNTLAHCPLSPERISSKKTLVNSGSASVMNASSRAKTNVIQNAS